MRVLITVAVFLVFVAGAFGYCREFSMDLIIHTGGGGDFAIEYDSTDPEYCDEGDSGDIVAEYQGSGGDVENIVIETPRTGIIEVSYDVSFDDIEDTKGYGVFGFFSDIEYELELDGNGDYEFSNKIVTDVTNYEIYRKYVYSFIVTCPYEVLSTNGTQVNSTTVSWTYSFYELVANGTTYLTITYDSE